MKDRGEVISFSTFDSLFFLDIQVPFSETQVTFIAHEVLQALQYLHVNGVIHRDIKGSNILLGRSGEIKVGDYGTCGAINPAFRKHSFIGTPHWYV